MQDPPTRLEVPYDLERMPYRCLRLSIQLVHIHSFERFPAIRMTSGVKSQLLNFHSSLLLG